MHLIERYSLSCGVKIDNPFILLKYYPIPAEKYICFSSTRKDDCKNYDHWQQLMDLISPIYKHLGYTSVQIGSSSDEPIKCDIDLRGITSVGQTAFIIKNCSFYIGIDSFAAHLAGFYDKKMICMYSNNYIECARPYWGDKSNKSLIQAGELKPSFSNNENPKVINKIKPEEVVNLFCKFHGIDKISFKTIYIGERCLEDCVDLIPDAAFGKINKKINVRMDKHFNEYSLSAILSKNFAEITTNKPISDEILNFKRITLINYISDSFDKEFIEKCTKLGIKVILLCSSKENLSKERAKLFEHIVHEYIEQEIIQSNKLRLGKIDFSKIKITSNKQIISANKHCKSYYEFNEYKNEDDLFLDLEWNYIYNIIDE